MVSSNQVRRQAARALMRFCAPVLVLTMAGISAVVHAVHVPFVPNEGQWHSSVKFQSNLKHMQVSVLEDHSLRYRLLDQDQTLHEVTERLLEADPTAQLIPGDPAATKVSYIRGQKPSVNQQGLPTYDEVRFQAYQGIEVEYQLDSEGIEKLFYVAPGADATKIRMQLDKATNIEVDSLGQLRVGVGSQHISFSAPLAWQKEGKKRVPIPVAWQINDDGSYGFKLAAYDRDEMLIIDPVTNATFFGGMMDESGGIQLATSGDVYLSGSTISTDIPSTTGGAQASSNIVPDGLGGFTRDLFIARFNADLTTLHQVTYYGGSDDEEFAGSVELDNGDLIIVGSTESSDLPNTGGGAQTTFGGGGLLGGGDAFAIRINASLTTISNATYIGGSDLDNPLSVLVNPAGELVVSGTTGSSDFPATAGGAQATNMGPAFLDSEAFVIRVSANLASFLQATYFGGTSVEFPGGIAVSTQGIYLGGITDSTDLAGTTGAAQTTYSGNLDNFIVLFNSDLTSIVRSTYMGGSELEGANQLVVRDGNVYSSAVTQSSDVPGTNGGAISTYAGGGENAVGLYIARHSADLTTLHNATYYGGTGVEAGILRLEETANGDIYLSGSTTSADLPGVTGGFQTTLAGGNGTGDAFIAKFDADLDTLIQATYFGGTGDEFGFMTMNGNLIYLSGLTTSTDLPMTTGGIQETYGGQGVDEQGDVFAAIFNSALTSVTQATYYGGSDDESGGLFISADGSRAYIAGDSRSSSLPGTDSGLQPANAGGNDLFVALISTDLAGGSGGGGGGGNSGTAGPLGAAVLPSTRAPAVGQSATGFVTIINVGDGIAVNCSISPTTVVQATFSYQTTDSVTNALIGTPDTPVDIAAGGAQSFFFQFTPTSAFAATEIEFSFDCDNTDPAGVIPGVNTFILTSTASAGPDIIAIALTTTNDGIAHIPGANGSVAASLATANVGAGGTITVTTDTGGVDLGLSIFVCQTDALGACLASPSTEVMTTIGNLETPTFSIFINGSGNVPADAANNRININFFDGSALVGQSSIAVQTD